MPHVEPVVIGCCIHDRARGELRRVADGAPVPIRPQSMRVLERLVDDAGRLVTRDTLTAAVWPGVVVTDDSLVQCIAEIRRAIGDDRRELIRTVPKRGYRLDLAVPHAAEIHTPAAGAKHTRPARRSVLGASALAALLAALAVGWTSDAEPPGRAIASPDVVRPALAVLAFRPPHPEPATQALGSGWAEDLAQNLARDVDLRIVATRSSFAVDPRTSPTAAARALGVRYLVDGTVRQVGGHLQVTTQLLDGRDGTIVWTDRLELTSENFAQQRQALVRKLAASVQASMRRREKALGRQPAGPIDAHVLTLRAYGNKHRYDPDAYRSARTDLEEALRLAPDSAAAWAGLGYLNGIDAINRITGEWTLQRLPAALAQIDRAISLDPTLSLAFQARAIVLGAMRRPRDSLEAAEQAVRLAPGDPDNLVVLAKSQTEVGRVDAGVASIGAALDLYPIEPVYVSFIAAHVLWAAARHDDAVARARRCVDAAPKFTNCRVTLASALAESGRLDEALEQGRQIRALVPGASSVVFTNLFDGVPPLRERRRAVADTLGFARGP